MPSRHAQVLPCHDRSKKLQQNQSIRYYRAALTTGTLVTDGRRRLFTGYAELEGINQAQRIGATMPLTQPLREWFQSLGEAVIEALNAFGESKPEEDDDV